VERESSLFDRIGGARAIASVIERLHEKLLEDPVTKPFFAELDLDALVAKQTTFMACAFGEPEPYRGRDLRTAHADLVRDHGLSDVHFDAVAHHLEVALRDSAIDEATIDEVMMIIAGTRDEVLGR